MRVCVDEPSCNCTAIITKATQKMTMEQSVRGVAGVTFWRETKKNFCQSRMTSFQVLVGAEKERR